MRQLFASLLLLLAPFGCARAIALSDLPAQLQACIGSHDCVVDTSSGPVASIGTMESYRFYDNLSGTPTTGYALRYNLLPPSGLYDYSVLGQSYAGDVWLTVQDTYSLAADSNRVTVYTDTVSPLPWNLFYGDSDGLDIAIDLTNPALLSGAGFEIIGLDNQNGSIYKANMTLLSDSGAGNALLPCLAEGCLSTARLNLLYLSFMDAGNGTATLIFNPADTRALLYQITNQYNESPSNGGFDFRQSYYVATVPVPAAFWLFLSGLVMLGGRLRLFRD